MKAQSLIMKRTGQLYWRIKGNNHCGPANAVVYGSPSVGYFSSPQHGGKLYPAVMPVQFTLVAECAPSLDKQGFLFDQTAVQTWLDSQASVVTGLSCEALSMRTAERLQKHLKKLEPTLQIIRIEFTLSPAPYMASVTAKYWL